MTEKNEELHQTGIRIPRKLWEEIALINIKKKEKMNNLIIRLLTEYRDKQKNS